MEVSSTSPQAAGVEATGGGIRVTKIAQDQQKADGQAAIALIESAAVSSPQPVGNSGHNVDTHA